MNLKSIHLINFQRHKDLKVEFTDGLNIIHGESHVGKSSIRRGIEWVFFNKSVDGIRRCGSKTTVVTVELDSGDIVSRTRSASINRYEIKYKNGEEQTFDSVGRSMPEEVSDVLKIKPIKFDDEEIYLNSQHQIGMPFLMDKSPSSRMKLFNELSGNSVLDKLLSQFNKDILRNSKNLKSEEETFEKRGNELKEKSKECEKSEIRYEKFKKDIKIVIEKEEKYSKLLELNELLLLNNKKLLDTKDELKSSKDIQTIETEQLTKNIDHLKELKKLKNDSEKVFSSLDRASADLKGVCVPEMKPDEINTKIKRLDNLKEVCYTYKELNDKFNDAISSIKEVEKNVISSIKEYKNLLMECKTCPTCGSEMTEEHLKEI